jgi:hypothetical protein
MQALERARRTIRAMCVIYFRGRSRLDVRSLGTASRAFAVPDGLVRFNG